MAKDYNLKDAYRYTQENIFQEGKDIKHEYRLVLDEQDKKFLIEAITVEVNGYIEIDHGMKKSSENRISRLIKIMNQLENK